MFPDAGIKGRRKGKRLRNVIWVDTDDESNMKGRLYIFQEQPFGGSTNYVALVCFRANFDVQDLRRLLV